MSASVTTYLKHWAIQRPTLLRELIYRLVDPKPVVILGDTVLVLGHAEALNVLERDTEFQLSQTVRDRFPGRKFLLTMEDSPSYQCQKAMLERGFYSSAFDIRDEVDLFVQERCAEILTPVFANGGDFDVVGDFSEQIAADVVYKFLIGPSDQVNCAPYEFIKHIRTLSKLVITTNKDDYRLQRTVPTSNGYLTTLIEHRTNDGHVSKDATSRLLQIGMPAEIIVDSIAGMTVAGVGNIAAMIGKSFNELLHRPEILEQAQAGVRATLGPVAKRKLSLHYVFEALRFNPVFPFLTRHCVRRTSIETRYGENIEIKPGASVMVVPFASMHDSQTFPDPRRFLLERPLRNYMHFGHGLHHCFGLDLAKIQASIMASALLGCDRTLQRAQEKSHAQYLEYEGPYLRHFWVNLK